MLTRRLALLAGMLALLAAVLPVSRRAAAKSDRVPDQYIVVFKDTVDNPDGKAQALAGQHGFALQRTYSVALKAFAAVIPAARLARIQADPDVAFVDQDQVFSIAGPQPVPTGIKRIDG